MAPVYNAFCFVSVPTEDWLPGGLAVLSWEHWCHHADNQSNPKGQWFFKFFIFFHLHSAPSVTVFHPSANIFNAVPIFTSLFRRISAVPTSMTQVLPSPACLVLWPLTWLGTWPMTSWHWWVMEKSFTNKESAVAFFLTQFLNLNSPASLLTSDIHFQKFELNCLYSFCFFPALDVPH